MSYFSSTQARPTALRPAVACNRPCSARSWRIPALLEVRAGVPQPETEKERSPIDFPQEWTTPQPSKRPDIFPEFDPLQPALPQPLPGDPEQPEDEEWDEEQKTKPDTDPDKIFPEEDSDEEGEEGEEGDEKKKEGPQPGEED